MATRKSAAKAVKKVGLIVGREWSFPPAFIAAVNARDAGVEASFPTFGGTHHDVPVDYAVLIDRISHEVPMYRSVLKHAVLGGTTVVNNPFMWTADDKFLGASLITRLGVTSPRTVLLPNKEYVEGIVPSESLRNLAYPVDWQGIVDHVGLPCILKDAHGGGWKEVYVCRSLEELLHNYDESGLLTMIAQEFVDWDQFVRCMCLGQEEILVMHYDPRARKCIVDDDYLTAPVKARVTKDARTICAAFGYDMNSVEFAIKDGVPYAIDFMNPAPDMDLNSLTPHYFDWTVKHMADLVIRLAKEQKQKRDPAKGEFLLGRRE